jgi:hypothetical protein
MYYYYKQFIYGGRSMKLLRSALKKERWDLAAHAIVLAALTVIGEGERANGKAIRGKKGHTKG